MRTRVWSIAVVASLCAIFLSACAGEHRAIAEETAPPFASGKGKKDGPIWRYYASNGVQIMSFLPGAYGSQVNDGPDAVRRIRCAFAEAMTPNGPFNLFAMHDLGAREGNRSISFESRDPGKEVVAQFVPKQPKPQSVQDLAKDCPG